MKLNFWRDSWVQLYSIHFIDKCFTDKLTMRGTIIFQRSTLAQLV